MRKGVVPKGWRKTKRGGEWERKWERKEKEEERRGRVPERPGAEAAEV